MRCYLLNHGSRPQMHHCRPRTWRIWYRLWYSGNGENYCASCTLHERDLFRPGCRAAPVEKPLVSLTGSHSLQDLPWVGLQYRAKGTWLGCYQRACYRAPHQPVRPPTTGIAAALPSPHLPPAKALLCVRVIVVGGASRSGRKSFERVTWKGAPRILLFLVKICTTVCSTMECGVLLVV